MGDEEILSGTTSGSTGDFVNSTDTIITTEVSDSDSDWVSGTDPVSYVFTEEEMKAEEKVDGDTEEEISEEAQKIIDKIGTPGKRKIDDLIAAFKVDKANPGKISYVEQLEDESWSNKVFDVKEPDTAGAAPDERPIDLGT